MTIDIAGERRESVTAQAPPAARPRVPARRIVDRGGRWLAAGLTAAAGIFMLLTAFGPLGNSLWVDEIHSVLSFIKPGPSAIWGAYTPNDHMLFELLTWATVSLIHNHGEATYRFWGVVPAIAAVGLMTWWLWRRLGQWVATAFALLAVTAPLHMTLAIQARGYGLGFFASVAMLITAEQAGRDASRRSLVLFGAASLIGIFALPTFVFPFGTLAGLLFWFRPVLRRSVVVTVAVVGLASVAFYVPVLSAAIHNASNINSSPVPLHSVIPRLFGDLLAPSVNLIFTHLSTTPAELVSAALLAAGALMLWLRWERLLMMFTILPAFVSYIAIGVARLDLANRYMSIVLLPLLVPLAALFGDGGRRLAARGRWPAIATATVAVIAAVALLKGGDDYYRTGVAPPIEDWRGAGQLVAAYPQYAAVADTSNYPEIEYYAHRRVAAFGPLRLAPYLCSNTAIVYVEHIRPHLPRLSDECLVRRHARVVRLSQLRFQINVWFAPSPANPPTWVVSSARTQAPPSNAHTVTAGVPLPVPLLSPGLNPGRGSITVLRTVIEPSLTGPGGTDYEAEGQFVAVIYRFTNDSDQRFAPAGVNRLFRITGTNFHLAAAIRSLGFAPLDPSPAMTAFARAQDLSSPDTPVRGHHSVETVALYAVQSTAVNGTGNSPTAAMAWTSQLLKTTMPLTS